MFSAQEVIPTTTGFYSRDPYHEPFLNAFIYIYLSLFNTATNIIYEFMLLLLLEMIIKQCVGASCCLISYF